MLSFVKFVVVALPFAAQTWASPAAEEAHRIVARQLAPNDALVLKFAQVLEQLESKFYSEALGKFKESDFTAAGYIPQAPLQIFTSILDHENSHTAYLAAALQASNDAALSTCTFNFNSVLGDVKTFVAVARLVELVGVGAYLGGATLIVNKSILSAAASILTIEARHQTALNVLSGGSPVPDAYDQALTPSQVLALAGPFISGCDLGIPANKPTVLKNTPTKGQKIEIDTTGLTGDRFYCQIITPGAATATSMPIDNCVIPASQPDGPIYIFVTLTNEAITSDINTQNATSIAAGPAIAFLDTVNSYIGDAVNVSIGSNDIQTTTTNSATSDAAVSRLSAFVLAIPFVFMLGL